MNIKISDDPEKFTTSLFDISLVWNADLGLCFLNRGEKWLGTEAE